MNHVTGLAELLRILILRGGIGPGELLVEVLFAERFRTSRSTLREALRLLEGRGLLIANAGGGMRVVEVGSEELADTLRVRAALEALSAAEAASLSRQGRLDPGALRRASALIDAAESSSTHDPDSAVFADRTFHLALDALAGNRSGHAALDRLWDLIVVARLRSPAWPEQESATGEHHELLTAIAGGEGDEASALARRHALALSPSSERP